MALQPNKTKIPVGTVLGGKYRITREIGRGGMAAVYEAENVDIGKRVAIKVLAHELTTSAVVVERFLREARAAAAIHSPYICDVYDSGRLEDGPPFLVLELLTGDSLYERMTKVRFFDPQTTVTITTQTCRGLTKAHAASIVHRDLKPENIFLTKDEDGQLLAKILDFGLAKFYAPMEGSKKQQRLTREGAVFGTPAYMSPEQVRGQGAVDHRADLWALACIVYECLTGRTVWATEQGVAMTFAQIAGAPLPRPAEFRPDLPASFTLWFDRALSRDITQRFQTAKELADELAMALLVPTSRPSFSAVGMVQPALAPPPAPPPPPPPRPPPAAPTRPYAEPAPNPFLPSLQQQPGPSAFGPGALSSPFASSPPPRPSPPHGSPDPRAHDPWMQSAPGFPTEVPGPPPPSPSPGVRNTDPTVVGFGRRGPPRAAVIAGIAGAAALVAGTFYLGWTQLIDPPSDPKPTDRAAASASVSSSGTMDPSVNRPAPAPPQVSLMPWVAQVLEAQQAISTGDLKSAAELLRRAQLSSGNGFPKTMLEHLAVATANVADPKATCRLTGLARPRSYDLVSSQIKPIAAGRPAIALSPRGAVMTWTDAHEGTEHAYTVTLDGALRNAIAPVDVTPEATHVTRPELITAGDRLVLTYSDARGPEAGVHLRFLNADGRIDGAPVSVLASAKAGTYWPSAVRASDGSFHVSWIDEGDADSEDVFLRHLGPTLKPDAAAVRLTDLSGPTRSRARAPSIAIANGALFIAFKHERDPLRLIQQLRLPLEDAGKSVEQGKKGGPKIDRTVGELALVNTDKSRGDAPSLACGGGTCLVAWHVEGGGAAIAYLDPEKAQPLWRKKLSPRGGHPAVAVTAAGVGQVAWFEGRQVLTATISREGLGPPSRVARISGDIQTPSIAAGAVPGEWYLAWLDYETGHLEAYGARVLCR